MKRRPGGDASRLHRVGDDAVLIDHADTAGALAALRALQADPPPGTTAPVMGATTIGLTLLPGADRESITERLLAITPDVTSAAGRKVIIDTVFDGEDLAEIAAGLGMSADALVASHTAITWTAAFAGFAPGFCYLTADRPVPVVPRRDTPRTSVPAGSVALAGEYAGIYPRSSPGGWQLIGRTAAVLFDPDRDPPALIAPGDTVRFRRVSPPSVRTVETEVSTGSVLTSSTDGGAGGLRVDHPGLLALVTDHGRPGRRGIGVPTSGAADRGAHDAANRAVGNPPGAATIELTHGGARFTAIDDLVAAVTGAVGDLATSRDGRHRPRSPGRPFALRAGDTLRIGAPGVGLRSYLAVRGGIDTPQVLGSRATDTLSGLGPDPLAPGTVVAVGPSPTAAVTDVVVSPVTDAPLRVGLGPRDDRFTADAITALTNTDWQVSTRSDRIAARLTGGELVRADTTELPSEPLVPGSIQVPPDGRPVLFGADAPVTGGYPVIAVVLAADRDRIGQLAPGATVRFTLEQEERHG